MADFEYRATLDSRQILRELRKINDNIQRIADQGDTQFKRIGNAAGASGVKIGAIAGVVGALTTEFINAGKAAVRFFEQTVKKSVSLATELETTEAIFKGIFGKGNEVEATAALERIRATSRELGVDLTELGKSFLPFVSSIEEFERVGKSAAALALAQPEQGAIGARIALQEALSGQLRSLRQRFELTFAQTDNIRRLQDELGLVEGTVVGLEQALEEMGRDLDSLSDTGQIAFNKIQLQGERFGATFGGPILEQLKESLGDLGGVLEERGDDFELIADSFGRVVANVVEFIGTGLTDFLKNLDTEQVVGIAENFFDLVENAKILAEQLGLLELPQKLIDGVDKLVSDLEKASETATRILSIGAAEAARTRAEIKALTGFDIEEFNRQKAAGELTPGELIQGNLGQQIAIATRAFASQEDLESTGALVAGQEAFTESMLGSVEAIEAATEAKEDNNQASEDFISSTEKTSEASQAAADAILAQKDALRAAAQAEQELGEALDSLTEKLEKIDISIARKRADALKKANQRTVDLETKFSRDREKDERALQRRLNQIREDAADERGEKSVKIAQKANEDRIDLERDFQNKLAQINRRFDATQDEAELNRDAIGFLRSERERARAIQEATIQRGEDVTDINIEEQRAQSELETLDDTLQKKLDRERANFEARREEARIAQEQELEDLAIQQQREEEKIREFETRKLQDLQRSAQEELNIIQEHTGAQIDLLTEREQLKTLIVQQETDKRIAAIEAEAQALEDASRILENARKRADEARKKQSTLFDPFLHRRPVSRQGGGPLAAGQPVPLPPSISNISNANNNSINISQLNAGGGNNMDRFITQREMLTIFQRLQRR